MSVILNKRNRGREEAGHTPSLCPNYCVTVGLSPISPLPSTLIYPAATVLYRPIWIKGEWPEKRGRPKHEQKEGRRWGRGGVERDVMDFGTVCSQLASLLAVSPVSLLRVIA